MRWISYGFSFLLIAAILGGAALCGWCYKEATSRIKIDNETLFVVDRGNGVSVVADRLYKQKLITNALLFKVIAKARKQDTLIKAGEYQISEDVNMLEVLDLLVKGEVFQRSFTVPEGLTSWQIVALINEIDVLKGKIETIPREGSLLPETYNYVLGDSKENQLKNMQKLMKRTIDELWDNRAADLPVKTKEETIILASIVEKETGVASERKKVAGVFINRLKKGMKLQTDPTVIYALTSGKIEDKGMGPLGRRLLKKDLEIDSPYNTYKYEGLPPGPIANPGYESIFAVLHPETHDYLYFVANGEGGHFFAKTLEEHNKNVSKWRKIRKNKGI
jgi:UPF0755 protein